MTCSWSGGCGCGSLWCWNREAASYAGGIIREAVHRSHALQRIVCLLHLEGQLLMSVDTALAVEARVLEENVT